MCGPSAWSKNDEKLYHALVSVTWITPDRRGVKQYKWCIIIIIINPVGRRPS